MRWLHGDSSFCTPSTAGTTPTWGFLVKVQTRTGVVNFFVTDSGTGTNLNKDFIDSDGVNWGTPLDNLGRAMKSAGLSRLDLWQGGPETRVIRQARFVVPAWHPKVFQPQHWADTTKNIFAGIPFSYIAGPTLTQYLKDQNVALVVQKNYFDAIRLTTDEVVADDNSAAKGVAGLPASGPGPTVLVENPRIAQSVNKDGECPGD